jgi:hypothetical protein
MQQQGNDDRRYPQHEAGNSYKAALERHPAGKPGAELDSDEA